MAKLNLGCGNKHPEGFVQHDITKHSPHVDIAWDLNDLPWPWDDDAFEMVVAASVLEHLHHNLLTSMNEVWRILEPAGVAVVKLPYWKAEISWNDPTHLHLVGPGVFNQLDPTTKRGQQYRFYTPYKWRIERLTFNDGKTSIIWHLRKMPKHWDGSEDDGQD